MRGEGNIVVVGVFVDYEVEGIGYVVRVDVDSILGVVMFNMEGEGEVDVVI